MLNNYTSNSQKNSSRKISNDEQDIICTMMSEVKTQVESLDSSYFFQENICKINEVINNQILKKFGYTKYFSSIQETFDKQMEMLNECFQENMAVSQQSKIIYF